MTSKTFIGGPADGLPITRDDRRHLIHIIAFTPNRVAVYIRDDGPSFSFVRIRDADDRDRQAMREQAPRDARRAGGDDNSAEVRR
jgi:hypothetical protein